MMTVAQQLKAEGIKQGVEKTVINMLKEHASMDFITKVTGFTQEKIIALAKGLNISLEPQAQ
jgi:hypothetical protein